MFHSTHSTSVFFFKIEFFVLRPALHSLSPNIIGKVQYLFSTFAITKSFLIFVKLNRRINYILLPDKLFLFVH